ncbi:MAG: NAD(P)/FAD-dependent oxidoreductase, partial [Dehalococcoidia bacterium]
VHCTGVVSTECFERYDLPESLVLREVNSCVLRSPSGRGTRIERNNVQALILDRVALDTLLVDRAVQAGATLLLDTAVEDVCWNGDGVSLVLTHDGGQASINARAAIVATGYGAPLARKIGLASRSDVVSGCQAVVAAPDVDEVEVFTGGMFGHGGYGWLVPWAQGYALAGVLTRKHTVRLMGEHIRRLQNDRRIGDVQETFRCRPIPLGVTKRTVMDGILGVGDTVGQVKPTTGGGIYYGLLGADAAASTLIDALSNGDVSADRLMPYDSQWRRILEPEIRQGYMLRSILEQLPDSVVEHLHRLIGLPGLKRLLTSRGTFDWHSGPLTGVLAQLQRHTEKQEAAAS